MPKKVNLGKATETIATPHPRSVTASDADRIAPTPHRYTSGSGSVLFTPTDGGLTIETTDVKALKFQLSIDESGDLILSVDDE